VTRAGRRVTLVDRARRVCDGASARNGARLSCAYGDALASPALPSHRPAILRRHDPAFRVWLSRDLDSLIWGLRFLRNATPARFRANTTALLKMAARTRALLPEVIARYGLTFDYRASGTIILYRDAAAAGAAREGMRPKAALGIALRSFMFRPDRFAALIDGARAAFAKGFDLSGDVEAWSGARPRTPSSHPLIGAGEIRSLFVNVGHGTLGWTLCLGAAEVLASRLGASLAQERPRRRI
jgi:glycine/D-amino acid oxidase-like deaminating enzyme